MAPSAIEIPSSQVQIPSEKLQGPRITITKPQENVLGSALLELKALLSEKASVDTPSDANYQISAKRWSDSDTPTPGAVVNVSCEEDICATIKWATSNHIPFVAQSGAHGFSMTLRKLGKDGTVINLRAMNDISIDLPSGTAKLGAGALTSEVIEAAAQAKAHIMTGVCNSVGVVGALIGGGVGNLMSLYGLGVDNILSARLVTAKGEVLIVSAEENADLFWGLRGAGHNFGIVSELTVKAHQEVNAGMHWSHMLVFPGTEDMAKLVTKTVRDMGVKSKMGCTVLFARIPPAFQPMIIVNLWYAGNEEDAKKAFGPVFELSPVMAMGGPTPYNKINAPSDIALEKGGRKPCFSLGLKEEELVKLADVFDKWVAFTDEHKDAAQSIIIAECYDYAKVRSVKAEETAYPWRGCGVHVLASLHFSSPALDEPANVFGEDFRAALQPKTASRSVYVNFARGDEDPALCYGGQERLAKLRALKLKYDPEDAFSCYNPIH